LLLKRISHARDPPYLKLSAGSRITNYYAMFLALVKLTASIKFGGGILLLASLIACALLPVLPRCSLLAQLALRGTLLACFFTKAARPALLRLTRLSAVFA
jgi:hypothetical protein